MLDYFILGLLAGLFGPAITYAVVAQVKTIIRVRKIKRALKTYNDYD